MRSFCALLGLWAFLPFGHDAAQASEPLRVFRQEMGREASQTLRRRDGVVLWMDLREGETWVFGNRDLMLQAFLPGSWIKLLVAEDAALRGNDMKYFCTGQDKMGGKKRRCWTHRGHGALNLARALGVSCNLYFEKLGLSWGYPALREALRRAGFASAAKLPERPGRIDPARLAIGDEPGLQVTPEEAWRFWRSFIQGLDRPELGVLRQGLRRAASEGTARPASVSQVEILAKTGTGDSLREAYPTNGWFLGAYPVERPRWLLLIFLKEAQGFTEAADLAGRIFGTAKRLGVLQ